MKVALINGSPHKNGCTFTALEEIANVLTKECIESEIIYLGTKPISGCIACNSCRKTGKCVFNDVVNEFGARLDEFDAYIFGTPVHYAAASGAVKSFMDRLFYVYGSKMAYKPAATVVSCRRAGSLAAFDELNKYYTINNMPVVSSQYWNNIHGSNAEEAKQDLEGMQTMRLLAANMAWILKCIEAGKKAGVERPVREERIWTNYIR